MIKVSLLYPAEEGKKFDMDYYANKHMPLVHQRLAPEGLIRSEVESGISSAIGTLYFNTTGEVHEGFKTHGRELMGDLPNFTDIAPQVQISEIQ